MYLPSVQPVNNLDVYINGDVEVDSQAVIASGVILQATSESKIVIKAGACLGMGTVINAYQGTVEIGPGAIIGAGVLIIGNCKIGANACIGTASTIINYSVQSMEVILPGSLLGDRSRQVTDISSNSTDEYSHDLASSTDSHNSNSNELSANSSSQPETETTQSYNSNSTEISKNSVNSADSSHTKADSQNTSEDSSQDSSNNKNSPVIGEMYINQLLFTLFPGNKSLRNNREQK